MKKKKIIEIRQRKANKRGYNMFKKNFKIKKKKRVLNKQTKNECLIVKMQIMIIRCTIG